MLMLGIAIFGCSKKDENSVTAEQETSINTERLEVPSIPPGFEPLVELGEFDIWDVTDTARKIIPTVQLSANWSVDKKYNKSWQQFSNTEKSKFDTLVEKVIAKLTRGVEANGGVFKIERPTDGFYAGSVIGRWEVSHDDKYAYGIWKAPKRWRVHLNAHKNGSLIEKPSINVFISRVIIAGEE